MSDSVNKIPLDSSKKLNVLFINTDQQRFNALSCAGNEFISTPGMDRLAREGARFTMAVTPQPMCVAARCSFHTGLSIHSSGCIVQPNDEGMNFRNGSFDQNLARMGYRTEHHGRWHAPLEITDCYENEVSLDFIGQYKAYIQNVLGDPPACCDGQLESLLSGWPYEPDPLDARYANLWPEYPVYQDVIHFGRYTLPAEHTYSAFAADRTIDALRRLKDSPFSISSAYLAPHHPWYVPEPWAGYIDPAKMQVPLTIDDTRANTPYEHFFWQIPDAYRQNIRLFHARYYELLQETDYHINRILDALDDLGLAENTLVIFTADHGEMLGDHGLTQKFIPYQESIRIPMIIRLPGVIPAGRVVDHPVNSVDIFATIFDYLGLPCPEQDGLSLRPLIEGKNHLHPEYTFSEFGRDAGLAYTCFVSNEWKYVWSRDPAEMDCLFDLRSDPHELNNLLGKNPDRLRYLPKAVEIRRNMMNWMERISHPYLDKLSGSEIG
ncbi:MAG: sulfatase-like hydrolase/transferase [Armatimonadota bacterium]